MTRKYIFSLYILLSACILLIPSADAEQLSSPSWGYTIDLPEGFQLADKSGTDTYVFRNSWFPAEIAVKLYRKSEYLSTEKALRAFTSKLKAQSKVTPSLWRGRGMAYADITFPVPGAPNEYYAGNAVAVELPDNKGYLIVASYVPEKHIQAYRPLIISTLDGIYTDKGSWYESGPVTSYLWPRNQDEKHVINIDGKLITVTLDRADVTANQYVVDREFEVLKLYMDTTVWQDAWRRYYRAIRRDAYGRLKQPAFAIYNALMMGENPPADSRALAEILLNWTQGFTYTRTPDGADFISLPEVLLKGTGDCDSRALLLEILLSQMNVPSTLFISPAFSHALAGFDLWGPGARLSTDQYGNVTGTGKDGWLLGETTARVPLGMVSKDMADPSKWWAVVFPE